MIDDVDVRLARLGAFVVQALSLAIALVQLGRVAQVGDERDVLAAVLGLALTTPIHLQHLHHGLRGRRPPWGAVTLPAMAAVDVLVLVAVGPLWLFMLPFLLTSAAIILRPLWTIALLLAGCTASGFVDAGTFGSGLYLACSLAWRVAVQVTLVWFVATVSELAVARAATVRETVERERLDMQERIEIAVERRLGEVASLAAHARRLLTAPDVARPLVALDRAIELARSALDDLRGVVARAQRTVTRPLPTPAPLADVIGRARTLATVVVASGCLFPMLGLTGAFPLERDPRVALTLPLTIVLAGVLTYVAAAAARGSRPAHGGALVAVSALSAAAGYLLVDTAFLTSTWLAIAVCALAVPRRGPLLAAVAALGVAVYDGVVHGGADAGLLGPAGLVAYDVVYKLMVTTLYTFSLVAAPLLVALVSELESTRDELARAAGAAERRRLSAELHDVLGQALTGLALRADLARRLIPKDRARARAELDELLTIAGTQGAEIEAIAHGNRETSFRAELAAATELLHRAGVHVDTSRVTGPPAQTQSEALLARIVREGATNVLRHAIASEVTIALAERASDTTLEISNDGARATTEPPGTGLRSIADAVSRLGGHLDARTDDDRFRLRVVIPTAPRASLSREAGHVQQRRTSAVQ